MQIPQFEASELKGRHLITRGVAALPPVAQIEIIAKVRDFNVFTEENDPYGEHDFGAIEHEGVGTIFWKIDYYDLDYEMGSPDPSDPSVTRRVLTIMLASEY
ncbi:DUF3768 domain-containing protein [Nitratireductor sp. CAU 1489]|uniref:DUF3768 domain-containing protein n=2 Tax=Nitratireductor arenosus TaxID=2682096 RepID=A0A844QJ30_9HYPH|nr:DUF3768 domain-containing protein [Nitratireductor arenosus]